MPPIPFRALPEQASVVLIALASARLHAPPAVDRPAGDACPVRVRALGTFEVQCDGVPVGTRGKGSPRTLELLKAIIAFGARDIPIERIASTLWPDADGDLAKGAFDVAIHRLRKLIGNRPFLMVQGGKVNLDPALCWLDVWEFRRQADLLVDCACGTLAEGAELAAAAVAMLDTYRGHFLANEADQAWLLGPRAHFQRRFERAADLAGMRLQALGWHGAAVALYRGVRDAACH
jgi:DNA-binding SARP family transcriptional activator